MPDEEKELSEAERRRRSFERSLAGPSVGKAGLVRDQTEINRVIAEASKVRMPTRGTVCGAADAESDGHADQQGSKFYQNQVRKDKELTEKIAWFKAKRDELMKEANVSRLEADADRIVSPASWISGTVNEAYLERERGGADGAR